MAYHGNQIMLVDGTAGYIYTVSTDTFEIITDQTDADGQTIKFTGTFDGPHYEASGSYPGEDGTESVEIDFELYSDSFGAGTIKTTIDGEVTTEELGLVRADSILEEPTYGSGFSRITLNIRHTSKDC